VIFRILGPLEAEADGRALRLGGGKQRALLAMLLLSANEVVPRERLIDGLWGESPPETAQTALQVHVSQLRKVLEPARGRHEPEVLLTRPPGYLIRLEPDALDLLRFERLLREGRSAFAAGDPQTAAETLAAALALWHGQPLADLDSAPFARLESLRLDELRLAAIEEWIDAELALGRQAGVVGELETLVAKHPLRERLRGQLMVALYRCGRQSAALDTYQAGRRRLGEELGLEPGEALQRLERAILNHDPSLDLAPPHPAPAEPSVPTGTVTFLFTDIEGSTSLVKQLRDAYGELLEKHHSLLRSAFSAGGGHEIDTQGDAFFFTFRRARDAVAAAVEAQRAFATEQWPHAADVKIRIGIHTGEPGLAGAGYHGLDVVRAARISGAAYGGQILVSSATRDLVGDALAEVSFLDIGEHGLREIDSPERIFQVVAAGLRKDFPPPRTADGARVMSIGGREEELAAAAEAAVGEEIRRVRLRGRTRVLAALGALLLVGAIVAAVVELTGRSSTATVTVAPNSIAVIDPNAGRVVGDVPVGARPVAVAAGAGGIWVANADDGTVSRIDPKSRRVVSTIGIGADVSDVAVGFGSVWVANGNDGTVARINPELNTVERTLKFRGGSDLAPQPVFSVAIGAGSVWVARGNHVLRIDPKTDEVTASIPIEPPLGIAAGEGAVWVTTTVDHVVRIESTNGTITATVSLPGQAIAPVFGGDSLWLIVTFLSHDEVWRLDPTTGNPTGTAASRSYLSDVAWSPEAVWATERRGSALRIDPKSDEPVTSIQVGEQPTGVAVADGLVWISVQSAN
jgi:DNA-binding SARP family transcriptional activator